MGGRNKRRMSYLAKAANGNTSTEFVSYMKLGGSFILDIAAIDHVVGRVEIRGETAGGEMAIVDPSDSLCPTVLHQPEESLKEDKG
ncbi:hypothetical protein FS749_015278 [Ceratobasidium sp. UAMH 11750]|nr:hypothetical protein FS749_015278 [Ceratobasidium sp. UAMH 11750]